MYTELLLVAWVIFVGLGEAIEQTKKKQQIEQHNKEQQIVVAESMKSEEGLRDILLYMESWLVDRQKPLNNLNAQVYAALVNDPFSSETKALLKKQADWIKLEDAIRVEITKLKKLLEKYEKTNHQQADDNIVTIDSVGKG